MIESVNFLINKFVFLIISSNCLAIGGICKNELSKIIDKSHIPLIVSIFGIILNIILHNFSFSFETIMNGFIVGLSSVGIYELIKKSEKYIKNID